MNCQIIFPNNVITPLQCMLMGFVVIVQGQASIKHSTQCHTDQQLITMVYDYQGGISKTLEHLNLRAFKFSTLNKYTSFNVWVRHFAWNFKGYLWNSTQNILSIHWKIQFLCKIEILRALRLISSYTSPPPPPSRMTSIHAIWKARHHLWTCDASTGK